MAIYERHQPEKMILYQTVARAWPKISLEYALAGEAIPRHVEAEFDRYKRCGILNYGFVRLYCGGIAIVYFLALMMRMLRVSSS